MRGAPLQSREENESGRDAEIERMRCVELPPRCRNCHDRAESWWSYCAMCGYHIAGNS